MRIKRERVCAMQGEPLMKAGCCPYACVMGVRLGWAPSPLCVPIHTRALGCKALLPLKATCCRQGAAPWGRPRPPCPGRSQRSVIPGPLLSEQQRGCAMISNAVRSPGAGLALKRGLCSKEKPP